MRVCDKFMRKFVLIATLFLMLNAIAGASANVAGQQTADGLVEQAADLGLRGDLKKAVALLDEALRINPQHAGAWATRATALRKLGDYQGAIRDATWAIEIDPKFAGAYTQRAFAYQQSQLGNRIERSLADASKAIELDPTSSLPLIIRGNVRFELERHAEALLDFNKAIRVNPRSYSAYANRARVYYALGDVRKAREDVNKALTLNTSKEDEPSLQELRKLIGDQP